MSCQRVFGVFSVVAMILGLGCAPYVNIPRQRGDLASHNANNRNVLAVESQAVRAFAEQWELHGPFAVATLPGTSAKNHLTMMPHISEHATVDYVEGSPVVEVRQVFIRGTKAHVDLVYQPTGMATVPQQGDDAAVRDDHRLVTVNLKWGVFSGWVPTRIKKWSLNVDQALRPVPAPSPIVVAK